MRLLNYTSIYTAETNAFALHNKVQFKSAIKHLQNPKKKI